ncbi:MAG TPA: hypothetical protein VHS74_12515 [Solirubrobacterales bacterium]|nr:hypothetical protein [Solirubrobacterales bacterium]
MTGGTDSAVPLGPFAAADPRTRLLAATVAVVPERGYALADPIQIAVVAGLPVSSFRRHLLLDEDSLPAPAATRR